MKRIYVSYRRDDTGESYVPIVSRLTEYFGAEAVLRTDTSYAMRAQGEESVSSQDYRVFVAQQMKQCAALLLVIGPHWLHSPTSGAWDIASPADPARIEVEEALRAGIPVVPALVQQATMPQADDLPPSVGLMLRQDLRHDGKHGSESLLALVSRSGMVLRREPDFGGDAQRLCEVIENLARLEAANPQRAASAVGRTLRNMLLIGGAALLMHALVLAYLAVQFTLPVSPRVAILTDWQSKVVVTSLIDWGIFFLLSYFMGRRTGDAGLGIVASVSSYLIGLLGGAIIFADLIWTHLTLLEPTSSEAVPAIVKGSPVWVELTVMFLTRPFSLTFVLLALGAPLGLAASVLLGMLGGNLGVDMRDRFAERAVARQRRTLLVAEPMPAESGSRRDPRAMIFGRRAKQAPRFHEAELVGKVFISYRRDDSAVMCGAIYDQLTQAFGAQAVFKDVDMIPVGVNFERFINSSLEECVAQVVVIGPRWVNISMADGQRRLDDPHDFVRLEVESALRSGLVVIPVLTQGAALPAADELPESLRPLAELTPSEVGYAPKFDEDIRLLTQRLAPTMFSNKKTPLLKRLTSVRVGLAATTVAATWWLALFTALGVTLGLAAYHVFLLNYRTPPTLFINYLASAPAIAVGFALIGGAHLAYNTGRIRRALWLIMRAALAAVEAFALTAQIYGLIVHHGNFITASQDTLFKLMAVGAPLAGLAMFVGPLLFASLISTTVGAFIGWLVHAGDRLLRGPRRIALFYRPEDAAIATRIRRSLIGYFGRGIFMPEWVKALAVVRGWVAAAPLWARVRQTIDETRWLRPVAFAFPRRAPLTEAERIARSLRGSAIVLALVGSDWTTSGSDEEATGELRDPLLLGIETALGMNIPIIPTMLSGSVMPGGNQLPASVREFSMLNGAWVRNPPDYDGDTRRLVRVIEQRTGLSKAVRAIDTALPIAAGALLSALGLVALDAIAAALVAHGLAQPNAQTQTTQVLIGIGVALADLIIYGVTAALVMRFTNRRLLSVLTMLLGSALGATAGIFALHYEATTVQALVARVAGSSDVYSQFVAVALLFAVARLLVAIVGALLVGSLGALVGRIAYQSRERTVQERRLLAMVRTAARSEPLAELSARSVGVRDTQPVAPAPAAEATAETTAAASASAPVDDERERLLRDMTLARARARMRTRARLLILASSVVAVGVIALVTGGALFRSQNSTITAQSTANTIAQTATALARPEPYTAALPGGCGGKSPIATWRRAPDQKLFLLCDVNANDTYLETGDRSESPHVMQVLFAKKEVHSFQLLVDLSFTDYGTCAGLVYYGGTSGGSRLLFEVCDSGIWRVMSQTRTGGLHVLAQGKNALTYTMHEEVDVSPGAVTFKINGKSLKKITFQPVSDDSGEYDGLYIRNGLARKDNTISAEFSNFAYVPE